MKSKINKSTRSTAKAHKGPKAADTNQPKIYEVVCLLTQWSTGSVLIEAATPGEARENASNLKSHEIKNWEVYKEAMRSDYVEVVKGGQDNE